MVDIVKWSIIPLNTEIASGTFAATSSHSHSALGDRMKAAAILRLDKTLRIWDLRLLLPTTYTSWEEQSVRGGGLPLVNEGVLWERVAGIRLVCSSLLNGIWRRSTWIMWLIHNLCNWELTSSLPLSNGTTPFTSYPHKDICCEEGGSRLVSAPSQSASGWAWGLWGVCAASCRWVSFHYFKDQLIIKLRLSSLEQPFPQGLRSWAIEMKWWEHPVNNQHLSEVQIALHLCGISLQASYTEDLTVAATWSDLQFNTFPLPSSHRGSACF